MRNLMLMLAVTAVAFAAAAAPSPARAGDNAAVAVNLRDGSSTFRLAFKITRVNRDIVETENAAVAVASCTDCQTVAVAIQAVLVFSDPDVVAPTNVALAINLDCLRCHTLASAYQFVSTTGVVHFTAEGNRLITDIRRRLQELRDSGLSIEEIQARVDLLAAELADVLRTELVAPSGEARAAEPAPGAPAGQAETTSAEAPDDSRDAETALEDSGAASGTVSTGGGAGQDVPAVAATGDQPSTAATAGEPVAVAVSSATEPAAFDEADAPTDESPTGDPGSSGEDTDGDATAIGETSP